MFYTFIQNNTGGYFKSDLAQVTIIEADNAIQADSIAEDKGLYFDGVSSGIDCSCCGSRFYRTYEHDAEEVPTLWGDNVRDEDFVSDRTIIVYYLDGSIWESEVKFKINR